MTTENTSNSETPRKRPLKNRINTWLRWIHVYLSMFTLLVVLFFSVTGVTLNHTDWTFGVKPVVKDTKGDVPKEMIGAEVDKLGLAEFFRKTEGVHGIVDEVRVDDVEVSFAFKAPGYTADAFVDRKTGTYELTTTSEGWVAVINDLHKGRHAGSSWAWLIDVTGIFLVVVSLSGLGMLLYLKKMRTAALILAGVGIVLLAIFTVLAS